MVVATLDVLSIAFVGGTTLEIHFTQRSRSKLMVSSVVCSRRSDIQR